MELWNEARGIPRYDVSSWGQVFERIGGEAHDS